MGATTGLAFNSRDGEPLARQRRGCFASPSRAKGRSCTEGAVVAKGRGASSVCRRAQGREPHVSFLLLFKLLGKACVGGWPGAARRLQPEECGGEGLLRGAATAPAAVVPGSPAGPEWRGRRGPGWAACAWKWLPSTCTGTGEGETKVPNELVKHLYNFSSFYKEGLLYTIYTWR